MALPSSINRGTFIKRMKELGFDGPHKGGTGDHPEFMSRGSRTFNLPNKHKRKDIGRPLLKKLLEQADVSHDEWNGKEVAQDVEGQEVEDADGEDHEQR